MIPSHVIPLFFNVIPEDDTTRRNLAPHLRAGRSNRAGNEVKRDLDADPYLLLLLADQELLEGREEQARHLITTAYEVFDRKAKTNIFRFQTVG